MSSLGASRPPPDRFFRARDRTTERARFETNLKHHSTQKASYRIKGNLTHILSGHVFQLIATRIFYRILNIYKISRISRQQNVVEIRRPKITPGTYFQTAKDIPHLRAISKLSKYAFKTLGNT